MELIRSSLGVVISPSHGEGPGSNPGCGTLLSLWFWEPYRKVPFRNSIMVSTRACHARDPGSIPGCGMLPLKFWRIQEEFMSEVIADKVARRSLIITQSALTFLTLASKD